MGELSEPADLLEVGRITKPHGLRGDVLVQFTTDMTDERSRPGSEFTTGDGSSLVVLRAAPHKDRWIVTFEGVNDRDGADRLRGTTLLAEPIDAEGAVFVHEVIGRRLVTVDGVDHGEIVSVLDNPASDLMELADGRLVPMAFYVEHDGHSVTVDVPAGLLDEE